MPFRFSLAAVLRIREGIEEREERALETIQIEIAKTLHAIDDIDRQHVEEAQDRERLLSAKALAANVQLTVFAQEELRERRKALQKQLQKLIAERELQLKKYEEAHRNREMLTGIRQRQREQYDVEFARRQQKILDDVFLNRRK